MNLTPKISVPQNLRATVGAVAALLVCSACHGVYGNLEPLRSQEWRGWENLQGTSFGADCVSIAQNVIDCFARGSTNLTRRHWDGTTWQPWTPVQGVAEDYSFYAKPNCLTSAASRIDCFVRADNNGLYHRFWENGVVSGWEALGGTLTSDPECVSPNPQQIDCYARGATGELLHRHFDGNIWAQWENLGGQIADGTKPGCASPGNGRIDCMVTWNDQRLRHRRFGNAPSARSQISGETIAGPGGPVRSPKCYASPAANRVDCIAPFASTARASLGRWIFDGQNASTMDLDSDFGFSFGAHSNTNLGYDWDCIERSNDRLDCMELVVWGDPLSNAPGTSYFRHMSLVPNEGLSWKNVTLTWIPATRQLSLDCVSWDADRIDCFSSGSAYFPTPILAHASFAWERVSVGGKVRPP